MTEQEMFDILYQKHNKLTISLSEACRYRDLKMSKSSIDKLFGGKNALPESIILKNKLLPKWELTKGGQRRWSLASIAKWLVETEVSNEER